MYRNNFSISCEYDGLECDRDGLDMLRKEIEAAKFLDRETARCNMVDCCDQNTSGRKSNHHYLNNLKFLQRAYIPTGLMLIRFEVS